MRGFTLIETIIYIALLGFLLGSVMTCVYYIARSGDLFVTATANQDEGAFVVGKLNWALDSLSTITTPSTGVSQTLSVTRNDGTQVDVRLNNGAIEMREGGGSGTYTPITTANVTVSNLQFEYFSGTPAGIEASTTIGGQIFTTKRYLRK